MEKSYNIGYKIKKVVKYSISFNFPYLQPTVTGPSYVYSETYNYFYIDLNGYNIEQLTVLNAAYTFNASSGELMIHNVTNNVSVTISASSKNLCTLQLKGYYYSSQGQVYGYWPATGTITFTNKYGVQEVFDVADAHLSTFPQVYYLTDKILEGTDVICTNIALGTNYGTPSHRDVEFYQGPELPAYLVYAGPGNGASYTFENVQSRGSGIRPSLVIAPSGY